ncbi:MAG TPA: substrate-binding domain-containing protein [Ignavibacteriales bacterium]|nr:substrate-binding domain-containing protein [Ignavibacteriales bacterium]
MRFSLYYLILTMVFTVLCSASASGQEAGKNYYPPWSKGDNNPVSEKGIDFTVYEIDNMPDFHGNPFNAELIIFMGGNYFFVLPKLIDELVKENPDLKGKIFYETLPPGIVKKQLEKGGTITTGNLTLSVSADVFHAGKEQVQEMIKNGSLTGQSVPFIKNKLAIMVYKGNPHAINSLSDLGKPGLKVANPDPETEGIAKKIKLALKKAGGDKLEKEVYETKVKNGEAVITQIHHRQTPLFIMQKRVDAGVVWMTEAKFQKSLGHPVDIVEIDESINEQGTESAAMVKNAKNREAAGKWLKFLSSSKAQEILKGFGFEIP